MSRIRRIVVPLALIALARQSSAQSTAEYRATVDSLANVWRPLVTASAERRRDSVAHPVLPKDSIQVGPIVIRADSQYIDLSRAAAEHLLPRITRTYGRFSSRLGTHQFVVRARGERNGQMVVATAVVDSTGFMSLRSSVFADEEALENSWAQKVEEILTDALGPSVRGWMGAVVPIDLDGKSALAAARVDLLLAKSDAARRCAMSDPGICAAVLNLRPVDDPATAFYSADQRRDIVSSVGMILRRANQKDFDRCVSERIASVCDSLVHVIPRDVIPEPVPPRVRQSFLSYALKIGGEGAVDRMAQDGPIAARIEAAARMPIDSVMSQWRTTLLDSRTTSTALDMTTALSSLFWVTACACLALRSSRWR